jgi:hypothetical protein
MANIKAQVSNLIVVLAVVVLVVSLLGVGITFFKVSQFKEKVTGFAASAGYVNITIASVGDLTVSNNTINWSSGYITSTVNGIKYANLTTNNNDNATVMNGNWTPNFAHALSIMNSGNVNCSLSITSGLTAVTLFASTAAANQTYAWNVTEQDANSCSVAGDPGKNLTTFDSIWHNFNASAQNICSALDYHNNANRVLLNVRLQVPYDAANLGNRNDTITITCS